MGLLKKPVIILSFTLLALALAPRVWGQWTGPGGWPGLQPVPQIRFLQEVEWSIYWFTNEQRRRAGLLPLAWDDRLASAARAHTGDMLQRHFFSHVTPEGRSLPDRLALPYASAGENIWRGSGMNYRDSRRLAGLIVDGWMASPGHRANILDPGYTHLGVGVAFTGNETYATQDFVRVRQR